jgi:hypothetical protein
MTAPIEVASVDQLPSDAPEGAVAFIGQSPSEPPAGLLKATLPPAIPPFSPDINAAWTILGQKVQYEFQLQSEMLRRADESNGLHDAFLALSTRNANMADELATTRTEVASMQADFERAHQNAIAVNQALETELDTTRKERDDLRDELAVLKLHKEPNA